MYKKPLIGAALVFLALLLTFGGAVTAAPEGAESPEARQLVEQLGERFEVLVLEDSYVLRPRDESADFDFIEIRVGRVTVDGEPMTAEALAERISDDAASVRSLSQIGQVTVELEEFPEAPAADTSAAAVSIAEDTGSEGSDSEDAGSEDHAAEADPARERSRERVSTDNRISFASSMTIEENEVTRDVVVVGGALEVLGKVDGDAVAVGGSVEVRGEVDGSVTAVGGSVFLGPDAVVDGDVSAIGGKVERQSGAKVRGGVTELSLGDWEGLRDGDWELTPSFPKSSAWSGWVDIAERIVGTGLLSMFVLFIVLVARRSVESVGDRAQREPWKAGLVGLIAEILFVPVLVVVFIVLMVSIIGIPLALIMVPASLLALLVLSLVGYSGIALLSGEALMDRFRLGPFSPFLMVLLGIALIQSWSIFGEMFSFIGGPLHIVGWMLLLTGFLIKYLAWTVGLGAVLLHGFSPLPVRATAGGILPPVPRSSYPPPPPPGPPASLPDEERDEKPDEDQLYRDLGVDAPLPKRPPLRRSVGLGGPVDDEDDELYREVGGQSQSGKKPSED